MSFIERAPLAFDNSDPGTGKTAVQVLHYARRPKPRGRCLVVCPKTLMIAAWLKDFETFAPEVTVSLAFASQREAAFHAKTDVVIINTDGVKWLADNKKLLFDFDHLIIDEYTCFPEGTLVSTANGEIPIEQVRTGDTVLTPLGPRTVQHAMSQNYEDDFVLLTLSNGRTLRCTTNHQILTARGWLPAERIIANDYVYQHDELRYLWDCLSVKNVEDPSRQTTAAFLWAALLSDMADEHAGACSETTHSSGAGKTRCFDEAAPLPLRRMEPRAENVRRSPQKPTDSDAAPQTSCTQGQRNRDDSRRNSCITYAPKRLYSRIRHIARQAAKWLSDVLQSRLRKPQNENSGRSRRRVSQHTPWASARPQERSQATRTRVVSVTREKPSRAVVVYNLEVSHVPYYYANGVCVHNCFKHPTSQRSKAMAKLRAHFKYRYLLSGTPNPNTVMELWHPALICDDGKRLGTSYTKLRNSVQTPIQIGPSANHIKWEDKPGVAAAVYELLKPITIRHAFEDVMRHVPPNHRDYKSFELSPKAMKLYAKMENGCILALEDATVTAVHAASLRTKLLQIASGAVYSSEEGYTLIDTGRYELIADIVDEVAHSVVFFNWRHQRDELCKEFDRRDYRFAIIDGTVAQRDRDKIVADYQAGKYKTILLHPRTGAHGLTLTRGTLTVFSSPIYEADLMEQGIKRIHRGTQSEVTRTVFVEAKNTVERAVFERLNGKYAQMSELLDLMKQRRK